MATLNLKFKKSRFNLLLPRILEYIANLDDTSDFELCIDKVRLHVATMLIAIFGNL